MLETNYKLNNKTMKKLFLSIVLVIAVSSIYSQKSIDNLFQKYAGNEGFTTLTLNGNLLKFASCLDSNNESSMPADVEEIRILTQEDKSLNAGNFYDLVINDIDLSQYEEFMRVKEKNQDVRMLVRAEGKNFKEFLLISGGEDNALIQIKGNMSFEDAEKFKEDAKKNQLNCELD
jgi:hypothetical protein